MNRRIVAEPLRNAVSERTRRDGALAEAPLNDSSSPRHFKRIQVVGVALGSGARDTGCEAGADTFRSMRLTARLRARGFRARWAPVIRPAASYREDSFEAVRRTCVRLARRAGRITREGEFPII